MLFNSKANQVDHRCSLLCKVQRIAKNLWSRLRLLNFQLQKSHCLRSLDDHVPYAIYGVHLNWAACKLYTTTTSVFSRDAERTWFLLLLLCPWVSTRSGSSSDHTCRTCWTNTERPTNIHYWGSLPILFTKTAQRGHWRDRFPRFRPKITELWSTHLPLSDDQNYCLERHTCQAQLRYFCCKISSAFSTQTLLSEHLVSSIWPRLSLRAAAPFRRYYHGTLHHHHWGPIR